MPRPVCWMVLKIQKGRPPPRTVSPSVGCLPFLHRFADSFITGGHCPTQGRTPFRNRKSPAGGLWRDAHSSASITSNSSFALSFSRWSRNFSMSKRFFSSQSAVYWKLGCFVRSYLSDKNGLTPRSWRMHLPPSSTASSSTLASSLPQCQVMNSKTSKKIAPLLKGEGLSHLYNTYLVALITRLAKQSKV